MDLADAHLQALEFLREHKRSEIVNVGTGQGTSVQEVVDLVRRVSGLDVPVEYSSRRPGNPAAIWADNTKARTILGWEPNYGLEDIIRHALRWHALHPDGFDQPVP